MKKTLILSFFLALTGSAIAQTPKTLTIEMQDGPNTQIFDKTIIGSEGVMRRGKTLRYTKSVNPIKVDNETQYEVVQGEVDDGVTIVYNAEGGRLDYVYDVQFTQEAIYGPENFKVQAVTSKKVSYTFALDKVKEKTLLGTKDDMKIFYTLE